MNNLLTDVYKALKAQRYTVHSFGLLHGYSVQTVYKTLYRAASTGRLPSGVIGLQIIKDIEHVTGYSLAKQLKPKGND